MPMPLMRSGMWEKGVQGDRSQDALCGHTFVFLKKMSNFSCFSGAHFPVVS